MRRGDGRHAVPRGSKSLASRRLERLPRPQTALSGERLALLGPVDLTFADSRSDPRVQVADLLAGVARRLAWEVLEDRGNAALIALLRPYVDPHSIWADDRSWSLLTR